MLIRIWNSWILIPLRWLQSSGVWPDNFTYPFLLKAFSGHSSLPIVRMIHAHIEKYGFYSDIFVPNSLLDNYCKCGLLGGFCARKLFRVMEEKDTVSWNSMIGGLVKAGELRGSSPTLSLSHTLSHL